MRAAADRIEWPAGDTAARVLGASARERGPLATGALQVLTVLYGLGVRARNLAYDRGLLRAQRAHVPIISIGNIVAGGAGKTPFTRWLAGVIAARGKRVAILHGGYGSDEPALHRQWQSSLLVYDQRDRVRAAEQARNAGADVVLLDDAFQHRRLARDLDIVLVSAETHSARLLPLGPLREPEASLQRADLLVVTRKTALPEQARALCEHMQMRYGKPCAVAAILPAGIVNAAATVHGRPPGSAVVVCAIARPDLLLAQIESLQIDVTHMLAYPDHHDYTSRDIAHITAAAGDSAILCTEKDAVKLSGLMDGSRLWVLQQKVVLEQGMAAITAGLERVL
ncbi:MAG TPA: tetraacyldisaccharide 4'-kinase [Longimicrobiales bacterium]